MISFENAIAKDYVTEKFYNPLLAGTVPIYRGAPNIEDFIPGKNSFVNVNTFESPKKLAEYMEKCYRDNNIYNNFNEWRNTHILSLFKEKLENIRLSPFYRLCQKVQEIKFYNHK